MANLPISGLPVEATSVTGNDYLVVAKEISPGVWETQKVKVTGLDAKNYANSNLVLTANRSHDHNEYDVLWGKIKTFTAQATTSPTGFNASFNFRGYGTTASDIQMRESSQAGIIRESYGDRSQTFFGDTSIDAGRRIYLNGSLAYISKSGGSNGTLIYGNNGSLYVGWNIGEVRHQMTGTGQADSIDTYNDNPNSYFAQASGNYRWRFGKTGNNGAIRGALTGSFVDTEILTFNQSDGKTVFNLPGLNMANLPTSPIGLSTGDLWNNLGVLNIV